MGDSQTGLQKKSRLLGPLPGNAEEGKLGAPAFLGSQQALMQGERLKRLFPTWKSGPSAVGLLGLLHEGPQRWLGLSRIVRWSYEALWAQREMP